MSATVRLSVRSSSGSYSFALDASTTLWVSVAASFRESASSRARTVTVFGVCQLDGVKVSADGETVTSSLSLAIATRTFEVGRASSATV